MKKNVIYFLLLIFALNPAFADTAPVKNAPANVEKKVETIETQKSLYDELNLTNEQKEFVNYLKKDTQEKLSILETKIKQKQRELDALFLADMDADTYKAKFDLLQNKISQDYSEALKIRQSSKNKFLNILDDKQKEIFQKKEKPAEDKNVSGAAASTQKFNYNSCDLNGIPACKIEDLLKKNKE